MIEYSKDGLAEKILGKREVNGIALDFPAELGYHCPECEYEIIDNGNFDERLYWSEYNYCVWCSECNKDYPITTCVTPEKSLEIFCKIIKTEREK